MIWQTAGMRTSRNDSSVTALILTNVAATLIAWWQQWPLLLQLWPYFFQNLIVGWFSRKRMLALRQFSTEGFTSNDQPVPENEQGKRETVIFFVLHYGLFHLGYLIFLLAFSLVGFETSDGVETQPLTAADVFWMLPVIAGFWLSHSASFKHNCADDLQGRPNIGLMMFLPYARVLPMHLMVILALPLGTVAGTFLFGALKTGADVLMHYCEHKWLRRQ